MECSLCSRKLKDPKSIERGYGPVCWNKVSGIIKVRRSKTSGMNLNVEDENVPGQMTFEDFPGIIPE